MIIQSKHNKEYKFLSSLHQKKHRDQAGQYLVVGKKLVAEALEAGLVAKVIVQDGLGPSYEGMGPDLLILSQPLFRDLARQGQPEGVLALCQKKREETVDGASILFMDRIRDPGNLGTIIRSAEAFGFDLMLSKESVDLYHEKVLRASMGSIFRVAIQEQAGLEDLIKKKEMGYAIIATSLSGKEARPGKFQKKILLIGNESHGLGPEYLKVSDLALKISMQGQVESLNAAISASILMHGLKD